MEQHRTSPYACKISWCSITLSSNTAWQHQCGKQNRVRWPDGARCILPSIYEILPVSLPNYKQYCQNTAEIQENLWSWKANVMKRCTERCRFDCYVTTVQNCFMSFDTKHGVESFFFFTRTRPVTTLGHQGGEEFPDRGPNFLRDVL